MKISIIVPISDNYKYADRAIISLINQTYKNIEILICLNGNSHTYNKKIIKKFSSFKKIIFYIKKKKDIVDALNLLTDKAKGQFIARLDCDDVSSPTRIENQLKKVREDNLQFLSTDGEVVDYKFDKIYYHKTNFNKKFYTNPILHPSIIIKSKILKKLKYKKIPYAEDYELYLRLEKSGVNLINLKKPLLYYQLNLKNLINKKRAFFVNLSTLVVSKAFRENLEVNENFFPKIKYDNNFSAIYKNYLNNYIFEKNKFKKAIYLFIILFTKKNLIKKTLISRILNYFRIKRSIKLIKKKKTIASNPLVSIIIPTFNSEKTIVKTLKSIFNQSYKNIEVIIIDNSDNKKTINIIKKNFKNNKIKIYYIKNKIINGEARNIGVKKSSRSSKIIAFCDSDDWWKSNKIKRQIEVMHEKKLNLVCTNYDFYNPSTKKLIKNYFKIPFTTINFEMLARKNILGTSSIIMTKNLFFKAGGFPESKYFYSFEDYFLWLKLSSKEKFYFLDENLTVYRDDRKNSASNRSLSLFSQRIRLIMYYLIKLDLFNFFKILSGNVALFSSKIFKLENKKNEYINLL